MRSVEFSAYLIPIISFVQENYDKSITFDDNTQALKIKWAITSDEEKLV